MNLDIYIPFREASITNNFNTVPILGIREFKIEIDRLQASYSVWVGTSNVDFIISQNTPDWIKLTPENIDVNATLVIDDYSIPCNINKYSYCSIKHAYILDLTFNLDKKNIKAYIYEKDRDKKEYTRFDLLDFEE